MDLTYYHTKSPYMKFGLLEDDEFLNSLPAFGGDWAGACVEPQPQQLTNTDVNTCMASHGYGAPAVPQSSLGPAVWPMWPVCSRPDPALPASAEVSLPSNRSNVNQSDMYTTWNPSTNSQSLACVSELGPMDLSQQSTQQAAQQSQQGMPCAALPSLPWPWSRPHPSATMIHLPLPRASMAGGCSMACTPLLSLASSSGVIRRREDCQLDMLLITDQIQHDQLLAEIEAAPWPNALPCFHSSSGSCSCSNSNNTFPGACVNALANGSRFGSVTSLGGVGPGVAAARISNSAPATPALGLGIPSHPVPHQPQNAGQELYPVATAPAAVAMPPGHMSSAATATGYEGLMARLGSGPSAIPLPNLPPAPTAPTTAAGGAPMVDINAVNNYAVQTGAADAAGNACAGVPHFAAQRVAAAATHPATRLVGEDGRFLYDTSITTTLLSPGLSPALSNGAASSATSGFAVTALPTGPGGRGATAAANNNNHHSAAMAAAAAPGMPAPSPQRLNHNAVASAAAVAAAAAANAEAEEDSDLSEDGALGDGDAEPPRKPAATVMGRAGRGGNGRVTLDELRPMFDLPVQQVVRALGISATDLKRRCRALGIQRWPQRKLLSLRRLAEAVEADLELSEDQRQETLSRVARNRAEILANPDVELEAGLKPLRQVHYKRNFMDRRGNGRS